MGQLKFAQFQPFAACKYEVVLMMRRLAASECTETGTVFTSIVVLIELSESVLCRM